MYSHHTVQVAWVQEQFLHQLLNEKAPPVQVAEGDTTVCAGGLSALVAEWKGTTSKLELVTTTTCASRMFTPVETREMQQAQGARSGPASVMVGTGISNNMQLQPPPPPTRYDQHSTMQQLVQLVWKLIL